MPQLAVPADAALGRRSGAPAESIAFIAPNAARPTMK